MALFDSFQQAMAAADAPTEPGDIARLLEACAQQASEALGFEEADIRSGGPTVMMLLSPRHPWEAVVVGPDAYQLYPGFLRDDGETIVWANVWVADDYTLEKFVSVLEDEFLRAEADIDTA
jgi:hypothetical protein